MLPLILIGCFHKNNTDESSICDDNLLDDFGGCWLSQECKPVAIVNNNSVERWIRSEYNFKSNGSLEIEHHQYLDSSCTGNSNLISDNTDMNIEYEVVGNVTNIDGLEWTEIKITMTAGEDVTEVNGGLFVTGQNQLCLSNSFYFGAGEVIIATGGLAKDTDIYDNCLVRGNLP